MDTRAEFVRLDIHKTHVESLGVIRFHSHNSSEFEEYPTLSLPELNGVFSRCSSREIIKRESE